jgi:hypothetical protein
VATSPGSIRDADHGGRHRGTKERTIFRGNRSRCKYIIVLIQIMLEHAFLCTWTILVLSASIASSATYGDPASLHQPQIPFREDDPRVGAVASENHVCSRIGVNLLRSGGNAADAVSPLLQPIRNGVNLRVTGGRHRALRRRDRYVRSTNGQLNSLREYRHVP